MFNAKLVLESQSAHNLIPYFAGFDFMYCRKGQ
jgi:hypothetical protein